MSALGVASAAVLALLWQASLAMTWALVAAFALRGVLRRTGLGALAYAVWLLVPMAGAALGTALIWPQAPVGVDLPAARAMFDAAHALQAMPRVTSGPGLLGPVLVLIWVTGVGAFAALMLAAQRRLRRALGDLSAHPRAPGLWVSARSDIGPLACGLRGRVVLPANFAQRYTPEELTQVIAHERAHLRRGDLWAQALASILQSVFWFHPLVHLAAIALRCDQELAVDTDVVRRAPEHAAAYANALLKSTEFPKTAWGLPASACLSTHPLKERIMNLNRPLPSRTKRVVAALTIAGAGLLTVWSVGAAQASTEPPLQPGHYRIKVDYRFVETSASSESRTDGQFTMHTEPGKAAAFEFNPQPKTCAGSITVTPTTAADAVLIAMPITCSGKAREPRLVTKLGVPAAIEMGVDSPLAGNAMHRFTVTVTQ